MRTGLQNTLVLMLLVAAAGASWWWSRPGQAPPASRAGRAPALGTYMVEPVMLLTAADGSKDVEIKAARLTELPDEERFVWEDLEIERTRDGASSWITAGRATGPTDGSELTIEDDVELRIERAEREPYLIRTQRLTFDRARSTVQSSSTIEVLVGGSRMTAEKLEANLNESTLSLELVKGMKTGQLSTAIALAAFSASATAQDDGAPPSDFYEAASFECDADSCIFRDIVFMSENYRLEAKEAHTAKLEDVGNGASRLVDARFEIDGQTLTTPEAVFDFVDQELVKAALTGGDVKFEIDGGELTADSLVLSFANNELVTAELKGTPATFVDRSPKRERPATMTAQTLSYDYRTHVFHMLGEVVFARRGSEIHFCNVLYDLDTGVVTSGQAKCEDGATFRVVPARREQATDNTP